MSETINPPDYYFTGVNFNPAFYTNTGFTEAQANALYLKKKVPDTATALETFNAGIKTNSISLVSGATLALPASTTTTPTVPDNTTRVPNCSWVNTTITNALNATTLFAKLAGTAAFTVVQTFNLGIKTNSIVSITDGATLTIGSNQTATGKVSIGSSASIVNIKNDNATGGEVNIMSSELTGGNINIGNYSLLPFPTWTYTNIEGDVNIGNPDRDINIYGNILGTLKTNSIAPTTTNGGISLGSPTGTMILNGGVTGTTQLTGTTGNLLATCDFVLQNGGGGGTFNTLQTFNGGVTINSATTPLTITASTASETYTSGGPSEPTMKVLTGNTAGASALSTTFYHYSVAGSSVVEPFRIFTTSSVATCQYMELTVSGILTRSPGAPNIFTTKATFVIHNFNNNDAAGQIAMVNLAYPTQYSSNVNVATISTSTPTLSELRISITINKGNVTRQNLVATLVAYPSMGALGTNTNFTITAPTT